MSHDRRVIAIAALALAASPLVSAGPPALDSLVEAERAFSAMSVENGMRDAFVSFLAQDGLIFRPLPVNGKKVWEPRGPVAGTLIWEPSFAEVSAAGDLGYTTGPWEFRPPADSTGTVAADPIAYGHFISVWKKQPGGAWKVVLDIGGSHERPERGVGSGDFTPGPAHPAGKQKRPRMPADLRTVERRCWVGRPKSAADALPSCAAQDLRYCRDGELPLVGLEVARVMLAGRTGTVAWHPQGTRTSKSDDLGYTYGIAEHFPERAQDAPRDSSVYVHIWRKSAKGNWEIALTVENPLRR